MSYQFLWLFFIYAFLGWCVEVSYAALMTGKFVNRGFLNGPVCPVYGFGMVIVLVCLIPLSANLLILFISSVLLTSILEWLTGFVLEKLFHQRWWDYSGQPFNLSGYICLRFSIAWGLTCVFVIKLIHPTILTLIGLCPRALGSILLVVFGGIMVVDLLATVSTIAKLNRRLEQIDKLAAKIKETSNELGENLAEKVLDAVGRGYGWKENLDEISSRFALGLEERRQCQEEQQARVFRQLEECRTFMGELLDKDSFGHRRLLAAFPQLRSIDHQDTLEYLRQRMEHRRRPSRKIVWYVKEIKVN